MMMMMLMCKKVFQVHNTPQQNSQCLHNFDLSEYRQILSDLAVWIFHGLVKLNGALIHSLIGRWFKKSLLFIILF